MAVRTARCPFCNSTFPLPAKPSGKLQCPRCDETFAWKSEATLDSPVPAIDAVIAPPLGEPSQLIPPRPPFSNGRIAAVVLGVMLIMALLGGAYAWRTVLLRRSFDFQLPKTQALSVPVIARVALGAYVLAMVAAVVWGWNQRERAKRAAGQSETWTSRFGIPVFALLVLVGVGLAIVVIQTRPVRGPRPTDPSDPQSVPAVLPSHLAGLGYLPGDVNLVAAVHVAECAQTPAGRQFLKRFHLRGETWGLDTLEKWTRVKLHDIDHAVLGVSLKSLIPRVTLVVRTIQPYDLPGIVDELNARETKIDGKKLYRFELPKMAREAYLWASDDRKTLVLTWPDDAAKTLPSTPYEGMAQFSLPLQAFISREIDPAAEKQPVQVWAACHVEKWQDSPAQLLVLLRMLSPEEWETLALTKTLGLWSQLNESATVNLAFQAHDAQAALKLHQALAKEEKRLPFVKTEGTAKPIFEELGQNLQTTQQGEWLKMETSVSAETIEKTLGRGE
ncbi:MAG: hypothetical protein ACJ8FY_09685 [Gemmataceae bacterium]